MSKDTSKKELETTSQEEVDLSDMDESASDGSVDSSKISVSKQELKKMLKEVKQEENLSYTVSGRNEEELKMIIKLAQERLEELKSGGSNDSNTLHPCSC